jgi:arginyl-tRNA synthetase
MQQQIQVLFSEVIKQLYGVTATIELDIPEERFGDYSTNIALKLARQLSKAPREIAESIADEINRKDNELISEVNVAGAGFINIYLSTQTLISRANTNPTKLLEGQVVVAEYSDANPFKILHAGHLYTSVVGDALANLMEQAGAIVHRVNFGGDVGLHVAKNIWAIIKSFDGNEDPSRLDNIVNSDRSQWLSDCYVEGNRAYEEDEQAKQQIKALNKRIYELTGQGDHDSPLAKIYWTCRSWSYQYFDDFYKRLNIKFEKYYPESEVVELGLRTVKENIPKVYQESKGAVIFNGEKYGLYTNVFINSEGLATYAAKDVGLIIKKWQDYKFNKSLVITSNEQLDYMKVVLKSVEQFWPELAQATTHLSHGVVKLSGGQKMSSRLGNILKATDVIDAVNEANKNKQSDNNDLVIVGAVKYSFLKQRIGADITYDPVESVSIEGNSGPYLQYAYARAMNILAKTDRDNTIKQLSVEGQLTKEERILLRKLGQYCQIVDLATIEMRPHHICTYLYELAQTFNRFYENNRVIDNPRQNFRLGLVEAYSRKLKEGLSLIGIAAPEKM